MVLLSEAPPQGTEDKAPVSPYLHSAHSWLFERVYAFISQRGEKCSLMDANFTQCPLVNLYGHRFIQEIN